MSENRAGKGNEKSYNTRYIKQALKHSPEKKCNEKL
jgi:hypothetical protein